MAARTFIPRRFSCPATAGKAPTAAFPRQLTSIFYSFSMYEEPSDKEVWTLGAVFSVVFYLLGFLSGVLYVITNN